MTIHTIQTMLNNSTKTKSILQDLQNQASKGGQWDWSLRPNLNDKDFIFIDQLYIDDDTQRDFAATARITKLKKIIAKPDTRRFKRVMVTQRTYDNDSRWFIVDGMGRTIAAFASGQKKVPVEVVSFNSKQEEVNYFVDQLKDVHQITGWEKHHVILSTPDAPRHTQALDIERVVRTAGIEYRPQLVKDLDCSKAFSGIKDSIIRSDNGKAGSRKALVTTGIIKLMMKHATKVDGVLTFRSDLFYPLTEFCMGKNGPKKGGLQKLENKIVSLKNKNGGSLTLDDMAFNIRLGIAKNQADKRDCAKQIKYW